MFIVKTYIHGEEMFIEIRLYNPMTYYFKGHVKIVEKYMVNLIYQFLIGLKQMSF